MGSTDVTLSEAKGLIREWTRATFQTRADSIRYHFSIHGAEVGAANVWQYLRQAHGLWQNLRSATPSELDEGKARYTKRGRYLILDAQRKIVSFGTTN